MCGWHGEWGGDRGRDGGGTRDRGRGRDGGRYDVQICIDSQSKSNRYVRTYMCMLNKPHDNVLSVSNFADYAYA